MEDQAKQLQTWWQKNKQTFIIAIVIILVLLLIFVLAIYRFGWDWTGFKGKTLWDWLQLIGVLAIPVVVWLGTTAFTTQQSKAQEKAERQQQYKDALQTFIDNISKLILEKDLLKAPKESLARKMAQAQTIVTLSRLSGSRSHKADPLQFMHATNLIKNPNLVISLSPTFTQERRKSLSNYLATHWDKVDLYGAGLHDACLCQIDLRNSDLRKVDLSEANLEDTDLEGANLNQADLTGANLTGVNLNGANLTGAIVTNEQLAAVKSLKGATMPDGSVHP